MKRIRLCVVGAFRFKVGWGLMVRRTFGLWIKLQRAACCGNSEIDAVRTGVDRHVFFTLASLGQRSEF